MSESFDLLVVGGGINGVGVARDAAGRGLGVLLVEQGDLAGATSSASSKMIHGGLRYLEHGAFRLVREGLAEREVLLRMAPHLVRPLRLVLPQGPGARPRWLVSAGLYLYDRLGGARTLPASHSLDLRRDPLGAPLRDGVRHGFVYADCRTDDARLTIVSARDAALRGAEISTRTALVSARREAGSWHAVLRSGDGATREVRARVFVNAAGPWVQDVLAIASLSTRARLRLVKGSHIVVPQLYDGYHGYLLQNDDRRIVFVLPFERCYSLIGTTELAFSGDPATVQVTDGEVAYLCRAVARWFKMPPAPADVAWSYAGVRPLYEDRARSAASVSRDYVLDLDTAGAPALSIFGGKLTTYRRLAEHALARLQPYLPAAGPQWTAGSILPGGERLGAGGVAALAADLARRHPFLDEMTAARLAESYGVDASQILGDVAGKEALGRDFGEGLSEAELRWLVEREWARTADDVLWRRTKLGLRLSPAQARDLANHLEPDQPLHTEAAAMSADRDIPAGGKGRQ